LPWLHTWGSGRFSGVVRDALYLAERIEAHREATASAARDHSHMQPALLS
jgi:putative flavoprotein involved in K+ transport